MREIFRYTTLLIIISLLCFTSNITYSQLTTVFSDPFSAGTDDTWTTGGALSSFSVNRSGDDWGARRSTAERMELTNDVSGTANAIGYVFASLSTSAFSAPYNTTLASNTGTVTWSFNMWQIKTDPSGFGSGNYGVAFILATNGTDVNYGGEADGYAVVLGQSGADDRIRLVSFTDGLDNLTDLITGDTDYGTNYLSIKVIFTPSTNTWELFTRDDSGSFADPLSGSLTSQGTVVNSTYTGTGMAYAGVYWQGGTAGSQTAFFDNIVVTTNVTADTDYFRSLATGNWNTAASWQSSPN